MTPTKLNIFYLVSLDSTLTRIIHKYLPLFLQEVPLHRFGFDALRMSILGYILQFQFPLLLLQVSEFQKKLESSPKKQRYSLKPQKPNKWRKNNFENGAKYSTILFANETIQVPAEKNVCTEFEENWLKFGTTRARVQDKPLNTCSQDPNRYSYRGSGPYTLPGWSSRTQNLLFPSKSCSEERFQSLSLFPTVTAHRIRPSPQSRTTFRSNKTESGSVEGVRGA